MNNRKVYFFSSLLITIIVIFLLSTGSSVLTIAFDSNNAVPLGTFITWIGLISLPFTIFFGIKEMRKPSRKLNKLLSKILKITIVLAILWVPIAYLLAGNMSFTFTEKATFQGGQEAMKWFWRFTYGIAIGALATLFVYWVSLLFKKQ